MTSLRVLDDISNYKYRNVSSEQAFKAMVEIGEDVPQLRKARTHLAVAECA